MVTAFNALREWWLVNLCTWMRFESTFLLISTTHPKEMFCISISPGAGVVSKVSKWHVRVLNELSLGMKGRWLVVSKWLSKGSESTEHSLTHSCRLLLQPCPKLESEDEVRSESDPTSCLWRCFGSRQQRSLVVINNPNMISQSTHGIEYWITKSGYCWFLESASGVIVTTTG